MKPYLKVLSSLNRDIASLEAKLLKAAHYIKKKTAIEDDFREAIRNLKLEQGVSAEQQIARILIELENLGGLSGARISGIKPKPMKNYDFYSEFIIELRFEAQIEEAAKFIYEIQQSRELLKIEKLQLNIKSADSSLLEGYLQVRKISI
jgi:Tfp pilus assembly protein PilO